MLPSAVSDTGTTYGTSSNGSVNTASAINAANGNANNGLAIDATAFGAMAAGQIQVISTAAGMGVRTDGQLAANAGDLLLSANGDVSVAGTAAQQQATVQSAGNVSMTGAHIGVGGYTISATVLGSNLREFYLPGVTGTGSKIQFVELNGKVLTIIAK
ncbi:filamentous hemagglutinin [Paraburkholderia diazotrophica]|uniref:Filamentous hemagglutinin n=1 Tax=Paraburkholderia diazotrophica TaxID=667676 RepID=A0A1H7DYE5_9BURK|nr:filamentous hemagglutinin [Paraburkholderia diazotrophica]